MPRTSGSSVMRGGGPGARGAGQPAAHDQRLRAVPVVVRTDVDHAELARDVEAEGLGVAHAHLQQHPRGAVGVDERLVEQPGRDARDVATGAYGDAQQVDDVTGGHLGVAGQVLGHQEASARSLDLLAEERLVRGVDPEPPARERRGPGGRPGWRDGSRGGLARARGDRVGSAQVERLGVGQLAPRRTPRASQPARGVLGADRVGEVLGVEHAAPAHDRDVGGDVDRPATSGPASRRPAGVVRRDVDLLAAGVDRDQELLRRRRPRLAATTSSEQTPCTGRSRAKPSVLAVTSPTRRPVNGPGPTPTAIAGEVTHADARLGQHVGDPRREHLAVPHRLLGLERSPARSRPSCRATVTWGVAVSKASSTAASRARRRGARARRRGRVRGAARASGGRRHQRQRAYVVPRPASW